MGSATQIFADRIDMIFAAIAEVAQPGATNGEPSGQGAGGSFTPGNLMWLGALLLLLGTVGVLVTARIALAVLLAVGPVFVVFALFGGTRSLTARGPRGVVLTAVTPLFVVTGGGIVMELLIPIVAALRSAEGGVDGRAALALFMIASVHVALMAMVLKVAGSVVSGWQVFGLAKADPAESSDAAVAAAVSAGAAAAPVTPMAAVSSSGRRSALVAAPVMTADGAAAPAGASSPSRTSRTVITQLAAPGGAPALPPLSNRRARGIGSRFRSQPSNPVREMIR